MSGEPQTTVDLARGAQPIGVATRAYRDCYEFARFKVYELTGALLPADHAEAIRTILGAHKAWGREVDQGEALRAGDLIELRLGTDRRRHVAVAVNAFCYQHFVRASAASDNVANLPPGPGKCGFVIEEKIRDARKAKAIVRVVRMLNIDLAGERL